MKLVGRMLFPCVPRVAATLNLSGAARESLPLSTVTDGERIRAINPARRGGAAGGAAPRRAGAGAAEKSVPAHYETARRPEPQRWPEGAEGLLAQARGAFRAPQSVLGDRGHLAMGRVTQADVTAAVALDFADTVLPRASCRGCPPCATG